MNALLTDPRPSDESAPARDDGCAHVAGDHYDGHHAGRATSVAAARPGLALRLIDFYQRAAEGRPSPCRFTPSCSSYAREAFEVHGRWRGMWLTIRRLARCRPFGPSGFDPVPERSTPGEDLRHAPCAAHAAATQRN